MKKSWFIAFLLIISIQVKTQIKSFRFAFVSDTHIGSPNGSAEEDLRRTVRDINQMNDIAFVVITGDITELGTDKELQLAKEVLDSLKVPYYIIPGNHDSGWSESGGQSFISIFGNDKFRFEHSGILFIGCASGPYVRMSDGHVPRSAINWLDSLLKKTSIYQPIIFLNHYPLDNGLDNWYEVTSRLKNFNTIAVLCGHGHTNKAMNFEDIPAVMGRSNLRARSTTGGYNLVDLRRDSIIFSERKPGMETLSPWTKVKLSYHQYDPTKKFPRPDFRINDRYIQAKAKWIYSSQANVISTPAATSEEIVFGNQDGKITAISLKDGNEIWSYQTGGSIFSSPAIYNGKVVLGSADNYIYCLDTKSGKLNWKMKTNAAVLGSGFILNDTVFIGGSDHHFRAIDLRTGQELWDFSGLEGPIVSTPLLYNSEIVFGAWDRHLYALNKKDGALMWKWSNGSPVLNYSPAACIPVAIDGVIYIVAPDRFISAISAKDGQTLWRNNDATVRESIGISGDGKWVYGKTMQDTIVAYSTSKTKQAAAWKMHVGFGYEHSPSMLIEKEGLLFFGTRNGVVYCIDSRQQKIVWAHKIDNSMVNTVRVLDKKHVLASTMDGKLVLLESE